MPETTTKRYLKLRELMERWQVSERTIYREMERNKLKKSLIAGCLRFSLTEVERYERTS